MRTQHKTLSEVRIRAEADFFTFAKQAEFPDHEILCLIAVALLTFISDTNCNDFLSSGFAAAGHFHNSIKHRPADNYVGFFPNLRDLPGQEFFDLFQRLVGNKCEFC